MNDFINIYSLPMNTFINKLSLRMNDSMRTHSSRMNKYGLFFIQPYSLPDSSKPPTLRRGATVFPKL